VLELFKNSLEKGVLTKVVIHTASSICSSKFKGLGVLQEELSSGIFTAV
jgi:hypothetical protein